MKTFSEQTSAVRKLLKEKLTFGSCFRGYDKERSQLLYVMKQTICFGESDSLLVVGPRGSGKTLLINTCLNELEKDGDCSEGYSIVRLNGFIHTDDNVALQGIIQQLHFEELHGDRVAGSFADNLTFVLQSLKSGDRSTSKPILFILEEFQLFCEHKNQTLLYNLFDIALSAQAPMCVVGVTCRVDISELLEKRVKSRFSLRQINLHCNAGIEERIEAIKSYLTLDVIKKTPKALSNSFVKKWNESVENALKDETVVELLERLTELFPSEKYTKNVLFVLVSSLQDDDDLITAQKIKQVFAHREDVDPVSVLMDLSVLEICLVIAMRHHSDIYEGEPFNFEMVLKQYMKFANQNMGHQITHKPILYKAFERLKDLDLISPIGGSSKGLVKKEYQLYTFNLLLSQVDEAVNSYQGLPTDVAHWATSSMAS